MQEAGRFLAEPWESWSKEEIREQTKKCDKEKLQSDKNEYMCCNHLTVEFFNVGSSRDILADT